MSESENHHHGKNEIIIVKRHKGGHDGAHGGAWKIAFADFMTAMMAFFLVMWLVNASNEETKAAVASYFNPIKLTDTTPASKGLKKPSKESSGEEAEQKSKTKEKNTEDGQASGQSASESAATGEDITASDGTKTNYSDAELFENPYAVLAEIAQEVGQQANVSTKGEGGAANSGPSTGASGGEAYRDPFDPDFWSKQVQAAARGHNTAKVEDTSLPVSDDAGAGKTPTTAKETSKDPQKGKPLEIAKADPVKEAAGKADDKKQKALEEKQADAADKLKEEIQKELGGGLAGKLAEGLVVTPAEGGLLVTLSDQSTEAMFNVGSAVPNKDMVLAMEKIGAVLKERKGSVIIRGHTDARPFANEKAGDNWNLSMIRAHAAYYMLVRGGLDENRIQQVSGFADRRLKVPEDPLSPANRRIEILLEDDG